MPGARNKSCVRQVRGVIQHLDVPRRELTVLVNGVPQVFDLEPGCAFRLHGERVRPRLLLPQDYARVTYTEVRDAKVAHTVHVR